MQNETPARNHFSMNLQANLFAGILTIIPIVVVWIVFQFLLSVLEQAGHPMAAALVDTIDANLPAAKPWLADPTVQFIIAVIVALFVLYVIGAVATQVIGARIIALFEKLIARIPIVESVYSAAKKLVGVVRQKPEGTAGVVLIEFPHPGLKAVGLVMRTFKDATTGKQLAAVFVPTSPNPTSGYLNIVEVDKLVPTDMTMDQAMSMVISGGATAPDHISIAPATRG